jgi:hypothetical protein
MKIFVGTAGIKLKVSTGIDLTTSTVTFLVSKPDSDITVEWAASMESPATAGVASKILSATDLDVDGMWNIQAKVIKGGMTLYGEIATFKVYKKLSDIDDENY